MRIYVKNEIDTAQTTINSLIKSKRSDAQTYLDADIAADMTSATTTITSTMSTMSTNITNVIDTELS